MKKIILACLLLTLPVAADQISGSGSGGGLSPGAIYGDGSSGTLTCSGVQTLTAPKYYSNVTISAGCQINTAGFPIFVSGTLTLDAAPAQAIVDVGTVAAKTGGAGTAAAGGGAGGPVVAATASGDWANPLATIIGGAGGVPTNGAGAQAGAASSGTCGAAGGTGGAGGAGDATGTGGAARAGGAVATATAPCPKRLIFNTFVGNNTLLSGAPQGGSGGGGGGGSGVNSGGGGGGGAGMGGGIVAIYANTISRTGATAACAISASAGGGGVGGAGTAGTGTGGGGGGGGGGAGGFVYIVYNSLSGSAGTNIFCADSGAGGNGGTGQNAGTGGDSGFGGSVTLINTSGLSTIATTNGTATQNLHSTSTGGAAVTTRASL